MKVGEKIRDKKRTPATEESVYILAGEPRFTQSSQRATQNWLAKAEKCYRKESLRTASFGPDP